MVGLLVKIKLTPKIWLIGNLAFGLVEHSTVRDLMAIIHMLYQFPTTMSSLGFGKTLAQFVYPLNAPPEKNKIYPDSSIQCLLLYIN